LNCSGIDSNFERLALDLLTFLPCWTCLHYSPPVRDVWNANSRW